MYFSSKEVQEESFVGANNFYQHTKTLQKNFKQCKVTQQKSFISKNSNWYVENGISQPFGKDPKFNPYYYSKGGPAIIVDILKNAESKYATKEKSNKVYK